MEEIIKKYSNCKKCSLYKTRTNFVWGNGNSKSNIIFVGEAPGYHEDLTGKSFVGRSGNLLRKIIRSLNVDDENDVCFLNILGCRPPNNRRPSDDEIWTCRQRLKESILACNARTIVALGATAWYGLLGEKAKVTIDNGKVTKFGHYTYVLTYHPAYVSRFKHLKPSFMREIRKAFVIAGIKK